ncbi:hypothetical protein CerSpe_273140 [Prunus speciosa]
MGYGVQDMREQGSLDHNLVKGKIVLCDGKNGDGAYSAGAVGVILQGRSVADVLDPLPRPASCVGLDGGSSIYYYINSTRYTQILFVTFVDAKK